MENFDDYKPEEKQELLRALQLEPGPAGDEAILCIRDHARVALWLHQQSKEQPYAGEVQKDLQALADNLDELHSTLERVSKETLAYISADMLFTKEPWPAEAFTVPRAIGAIRALRNATSEATKADLSGLPTKGPRKKTAIYALIDQLCVIYERCTGIAPKRKTRNKTCHEKYGDEYGRFRDFVHAVLVPLKLGIDIDAYIQRTLKNRRKRAEARKFVEREVKGGPISPNTLEQRADDASIPRDFLKGAIEGLGLKTDRIDGVLCYCPPDTDTSG